MLDWLWPHLSDEEQAALHKCLDAFAQPNPGQADLRRLAAGVEGLEKRFVRLNPAQRPDPDLQGRVLVCSVGMRPMPVILSILLLQPTKVYLLHSQESRRQAEQIRDDASVQSLGLHPTHGIVLRTISLTDAPENYGHLQRIIGENPDTGVVVDISGGVKVMGLSLAAAAFWLRIPVVYQLGEEVAGTVRPFSATLHTLQNPFDYFGSTDLRSIQQLFATGDYDAALAVCQRLRETVGDVQTLGKLDILTDFIAIYSDWDRFMHSRMVDEETRRLATRLRVLIDKMERLRLRFAERTQLQGNLAFLEHLESSWQPNLRNNSELHRLVDIYAAAQRRGAAGRYDDAVARLYRCLEMSATICLVRDCHMGDVAGNPDFGYFEAIYGDIEAVRTEFKRRARYELPADRLGLNAQMHLLGMSQDKQHRRIAGLYQGMEKSGLMEARNRSTLAHGTVPVNQEEFRQFDGKTREVVDAVCPNKGDLDRLLAEATHPDLLVEL